MGGWKTFLCVVLVIVAVGLAAGSGKDTLESEYECGGVI